MPRASIRTSSVTFSGCGISKKRQGMSGVVPVSLASITTWLRCWNATAIPRVAADLDVFIARVGGDEVARGQRSDGLADRLLRRLLLQELEQSADREDLGGGVGAEQHLGQRRPG